MGRVSMVAVAMLVPAIAAGQRLEEYDYQNLQFHGIGVEVGRVIPWNMEPAMSFGLRGDMGFVGPHVRITPGIRFWSSQLKEDEVERLTTQFIEICNRRAPGACPATLDLGEVNRSDLELSADAHIIPDLGVPLTPYGGGGLSLHLLNGGGESIDDTFVEDLLDTVAPGVNLLAGALLRLGSVVQLSLEGRLILTSDVQYGNLLFGGVWTLPSPPSDAGSTGGGRGVP
jgi:hypothetical protein